MDLSYAPEQEAFRMRVRTWLAANLPAGWGTDATPTFATYAAWVDFMRDWQRQLHRAGWCGLAWPREYGGGGATLVEQIIYNEEMARAQAPELINKVGVNNVGPTLINHGNEEQKQRFLPGILSAEEIWCQLYSEPGAGSDLASLRTRAVREGDGYLLTGQKVWTSYAEFSRWAICLARTDPDAPKHKGITYFIVDMHAPGITIRPLRQLTGDSEFNETFLDNVFVPREFVLGRENEGWQIAMNTLAHERGTGYLFKEQVKQKIALDRLIGLLRQHAAAGQPVHRALQDEVVQSWIEVEILRLLNLDTMTRMSRGQEPGPESSFKKEFWSRLTQRLHATALAVEGPYAQIMAGDPRAIEQGSFQQSSLYSLSQTISGGTSEVQKNIIATRMLGLPRG